ncbi:DNA-binding protein [Streptomyces bambusae]|uniref:nSTAND1 domain-containing NTPase n=1 Tax=Streptomyces bambusae TaxID=1550616 RepID=UPI001CFCD3A6|nr:DNA-binding protein [Streptomyces bambusae]MCB5164390.1 DNA-binding protein [Streptomyces bambusae]
MGRQEKPLDPAGGPVVELAAALRELRRAAGSPTYAAMARRAGTYSVATLSRAAAGEQLPTLPVVLAYAAACEGDPAQWETRWRLAADELAARTALHDDEPAPYPGLARFEPGDRELFFGRDRLVDDLVALTFKHRVVVVFGPSGSGKSSLLRAGLVPRLQESAGEAAAVRLLTPGGNPLDRHRANLAPADRPGDTWLIVDQFEEVFTLCRDPAERSAFVGALLSGTRPDGARVRLVLGVRADFYAHCLADPALAAAVREASLPVTPMSREELHQAVTAPAAARSVQVERALTARLVDEVHGNAAALPLLSHTLRETWHRRAARRLTLEAYEAAGGVHGAIARTAETTYGLLGAEQADLARRILLRLVSPGDEGLPDTRRPARPDELGEGEDVRHVLDLLAAARLVTLDRNTVELAHETLITSWPRLHGWVDESREQLRLRQRLGTAAETWDRLGRPPGALAPAALLASCAPLLPTAAPHRLTTVESEFVAASTRARTRAAARRRATRGLLALLAVLALLAGTAAWQAGRTERDRRSTAVALRTAAVAEGLRATDPRTAARLNLAAWQLARTPQTRAGLYAARTDRTGPDLTVGIGDESVQSEFADPDGSTLTVSSRRQVERWDLRAGHRLSGHRLPRPTRVRPLPLPGPRLPPGRHPAGEVLRPSPDGTRTAVISQGGAYGNRTPGWAEVRLLDLRTGDESAFVLPGVRLAADLAWGGGSRLLAVTVPGSVRFWDVVGRRPLFAVPAAGAFTGAALSADGRRAALCGRSGVEVWDVPGRRRLPVGGTAGRDVPARACSPETLRLSPDGSRLAVRLDTGILLAATGPGGRPARRLAAAGVTGFSFNRDGTLLAAVSADTARVWRTDDGRPDPVVFRQRLRPDGPTDVRIDDRAGVLRYVHDDRRRVAALRLGLLPGAVWSPAGTDAVLPAPDGSATVVLRRQGGTVVPELYAAAAGGGGPDDPLGAAARPVVRLPPLPGQAAAGRSAVGAFSPDGRLFAYGPYPRRGAGPTVRVWDVHRRRALPDVAVPGAGRPSGGTAPAGRGAHRHLSVTALVPVLRGGRPVVYGVFADEAAGGGELWNLTASRPVAVLPVASRAVAVRPDGGVLVPSDGPVVTVPEERVDLVAGALGSSFTAAYSRDGRHLALADATGGIALWTGAPAGAPAFFTTGPHGVPSDAAGVSAVAFSPDGTMLATGDDTGAVRLWDVPSRQPLGGPFPGAGDPVSRLSFTPDGTGLLVQGAHTAAFVHRVRPADAAAAACALHGGLDRAQWRTHLPELPYRRTCPGQPDG